MLGDFFVLALLILLSGFFSGAEIAFFSLSPVNVQHLVDQKVRNAKLLQRLKNNPRRLLTTILIGNNFVNIYASVLAALVAERIVGDTAITLATGVMTVLILTFGEILPKTFAQSQAQRIALGAAQIFWVLEILLFPISWVFIQFSKLLIRVRRHRDPQVTEGELRTMARLGAREGSILHQEKDFIERILQFNDIRVRDVMTPLANVTMLDHDVVIDQVAHFVGNSPFSRFPITKGGEQKIVGVVHANTVLQALNSDQRSATVENIMEPIRTISPDATIDTIFRQMQEGRFRIAVVMDAGGQNIGVCTMKDLTEELLGEFMGEPARSTEGGRHGEKGV